MPNGRHHEEGFTLVEMMLVVAILGIIVSIAVASYVVSVASAREISCTANQRILSDAAIVYAADHGAYPVDIDDLESYVRGFESVSHCPSDRSVELEWDSAEDRVTCPNHPQ